MSFISVEPQSRVVLESRSNSLLAQFDEQLRIITDRYLAFFQERRRIEVIYIDSLRKLHRKARVIDASIDRRTEPTTTRSAWDTVRDYLERDANTQQTFVDVLDNEVIKNLTTLKESNDETRKRMEEDLKESAVKYAEHAENKISRLQQAYLKKYRSRQHAAGSPNNNFGGRVSALFRGRRDDLREPEPITIAAESEGLSRDDVARGAVGQLNILRLMRAESLGDGYDFLQGLVFAPTIKDVLVKYMDSMMTTAYAKYCDLAMSTKAEVERALAGTDTSDLKASFRRALSFSIPPPTLYCNYRPGAFSQLIFGLPLVDAETNEDNVPKVMGMCIKEVEKRGLDTNKIYSVLSVYNDKEVLQLRRRLESEKTFSFSSTDNIHSVAALLMHYLWDLPEPLFMLPLQDCRKYRHNRVNYAKNNFPLLRSKIRELNPVHRATLEALLRHLLRISSHSDKNAMTVEVLASRFRFVLRGDEVLQDGVEVKVLVLVDLIRNAHSLFDEQYSLSTPSPSHYVAETASTFTYDSLFWSPQPAEAQAMATTQHGRGLAGDIYASTRSSLSSLPFDTAMESHLTPPPIALLSPLLGLPSSRTLMEEAEVTAQERAIPGVRDTEAMGRVTNSTPAEAVSAPPTSVAEWRLLVPQSQLVSPHSEVMTIPQSPSESVLSGTSDFPLSSATSLQTRIGPFSP